ncbi:MAG: phosphoribosyltransferase family protein [Anaerolineae bacterium]|nr:MAG: phosphoribosyltransferase family protein [Anaerolineae bacterium]
MPEKRETFAVEIAGVRRRLPLFEVAPGLRIAVLNILGDTELVEACGKELGERLEGVDYEVLVTAEAKSIPLICSLARETGKDYVVLRKSYKQYMGETIEAETLSITTGKPQGLHLDEKDRLIVSGRKVALVDDVISTGSTLKGMRKVMELAGAEVVAEAAIFTEGEPEDWNHIIALGHLPLFRDA